MRAIVRREQDERALGDPQLLGLGDRLEPGPARGQPDGGPRPGIDRTGPDWTAGCIAVTDEEVEEIYKEGWKLGLKAVALYRDGSKSSQPLNTKDDSSSEEEEETVEAKAPVAAARPATARCASPPPSAGPTGVRCMCARRPRRRWSARR